MAQMISEIWAGLCEAGLPEVMLYLPDHSASRCHWADTTLVGGIRVALLADQDRQIVRILPVDSCVGIGIASPKGTDPSAYKVEIHRKLHHPGDTWSAPESVIETFPVETLEAAFPSASSPSTPAMWSAPAPPVELPADTPKVDPLLSRWGVAMKAPPPVGFRG
ncbi:MAG: hypothetical protein NVSMB9_13560 [Isosphaeraceae bacterium]